MADLRCDVALPKTRRELEQAIAQYRQTEALGQDLYCQWEAIRAAALALAGGEMPSDQIWDEESY